MHLCNTIHPLDKLSSIPQYFIQPIGSHPSVPPPLPRSIFFLRSPSRGEGSKGRRKRVQSGLESLHPSLPHPPAIQTPHQIPIRIGSSIRKAIQASFLVQICARSTIRRVETRLSIGVGEFGGRVRDGGHLKQGGGILVCSKSFEYLRQHQQ